MVLMREHIIILSRTRGLKRRQPIDEDEDELEESDDTHVDGKKKKGGTGQVYAFQMLQADSTAIDGNRKGTVENFCHQARHQNRIYGT